MAHTCSQDTEARVWRQPRLYSKTVSHKPNKQKRVDLILLNPITGNVEAERTIHLILAYYCEHVPRKNETSGKGVWWACCPLRHSLHICSSVCEPLWIHSLLPTGEFPQNLQSWRGCGLLKQSTAMMVIHPWPLWSTARLGGFSSPRF